MSSRGEFSWYQEDALEFARQRDEALRRLREVVKAWDEGWDCSANPGHTRMTIVIEEARALL